MNPQILIYVINLTRSPARRRETVGRLSALGLDAKIAAACDRADPVPARPSGAPGLSAAEAACLQSHVGVLQRVARDSRRLACILEDDCDLGQPFADVLGAIFRQDAHPWDVLLLGHHSARHGPGDGAETCFRGAPIIAGYRAARVAEYPMGAYAYVVTPRGARALLANAAPPRMPADWVTGYVAATGARLYAVTPPCVQPLPSTRVETTIDDRSPRSGPVDAPGAPDRSLRARAGRLRLWLRKLGLRPDSYVRRL